MVLVICRWFFGRYDFPTVIAVWVFGMIWAGVLYSGYGDDLVEGCIVVGQERWYEWRRGETREDTFLREGYVDFEGQSLAVVVSSWRGMSPMEQKVYYSRMCRGYHVAMGLEYDEVFCDADHLELWRRLCCGPREDDREIVRIQAWRIGGVLSGALDDSMVSRPASRERQSRVWRPR